MAASCPALTTPPYNYREKRQKLEHRARTEHLEETQFLFKLASGYWVVLQGEQGPGQPGYG